MDGLRAGCLFFDRRHYKSVAKHFKNFLSEIDGKNENKPWAIFLLAECYQLKSKKKPSKAVQRYREAIDWLLNERQNVALPANPPDHSPLHQNCHQTEEKKDSTNSEGDFTAQNVTGDVIGLCLGDGSVIDSSGNQLSAER